MRVEATGLHGLRVIQSEPHSDPRGSFMRLWDRTEYEAVGISVDVVASNVSYNRARATLRGLHLQVPPFAETKVVRCMRGAIFDVAVDLRHDSPTFCAWHGEILSAANHRALVIPEGFAHGFLTLEAECEVFYLMSASFSGEHARGVRWDDPAFEISWPIAPETLSTRDGAYPDFDRHLDWTSL